MTRKATAHRPPATWRLCAGCGQATGRYSCDVCDRVYCDWCAHDQLRFVPYGPGNPVGDADVCDTCLQEGTP